MQMVAVKRPALAGVIVVAAKLCSVCPTLAVIECDVFPLHSHTHTHTHTHTCLSVMLFLTSQPTKRVHFEMKNQFPLPLTRTHTHMLECDVISDLTAKQEGAL